MKRDARPVLAVGWDVGGWCGKKQGVAVATWGEGRPAWRGHPDSFSVKRLEEAGGSLAAFIRIAWQDLPDDVLERYQVVLAIDAPLSFPKAFVDFLKDKEVEHPDTGKFINNRLAFRDCDRVIAENFKSPLSASFDKLGNPATVAVFYARKWSKAHGLALLPFQQDTPAQSCIIEVYPALAKDRKTKTCVPPFDHWIPSTVEPGTDEADACICALMALAFRSSSPECLPALEEAPGSKDFGAEGWIYCSPRSSK